LWQGEDHQLSDTHSLFDHNDVGRRPLRGEGQAPQDNLQFATVIFVNDAGRVDYVDAFLGGKTRAGAD
jgi:hypothetical protein